MSTSSTAAKLQTDARTIATLAGCMTEDTAAYLLTLAHEPELLMEAGDIAPTIDPLLIAAAQMVGERMAA